MRLEGPLLRQALRARTAGRSAGVGIRKALAGSVTTATVLSVMSKNSTESPSSLTPATAWRSTTAGSREFLRELARSCCLTGVWRRSVATAKNRKEQQKTAADGIRSGSVQAQVLPDFADLFHRLPLTARHLRALQVQGEQVRQDCVLARRQQSSRQRAAHPATLFRTRSAHSTTGAGSGALIDRRRVPLRPSETS